MNTLNAQQNMAPNFNPADFEPAIKNKEEFLLINRPSLSYWQDAWMRLKKNKQALFSLGIIGFLIIFTLFGKLFWGVDSSLQNLDQISAAPSLEGEKLLVVADLEMPEEKIDDTFPETPEEGTTLEKPTLFEVAGEATSLNVPLQWAPVKGATGYQIFRNETKPENSEELGIPLVEIDAGNKISYEDRLNIEAKTYFYSFVATNGEQISDFLTLEVTPKRVITLSEAQTTDPTVKAGSYQTVGMHPLGTDYLGRDMLARLIHGAQISLFIGFFAPLFYTLLGIMLGGIAGFYGGKVDIWLMRFTDLVMGLPFLLFMILFKIGFGIGPGESGVLPMLVALVLLSWTGPARLVRGQVLQLRESDFVQAARIMGAHPAYLILRHFIPNTMGVILISLTFSIPGAIFTESFLSFIGMGVAPPTPSWGSMCNDGIHTFLSHPHELFFPALFIGLTALAFNLLGDGLRDALDPKLRSTE